MLLTVNLIKKDLTYAKSFLVEARRVELLSKNQSVPASPSADIYLHSLMRTLNVKLPHSVAPKP